MVVLSDYDLIAEAGSRDELIGRFGIEYAAKERGSLDPGNPEKFPGVVFSSGRTWQEQRRFSLHALRDLGFGKSGTEELAVEEVGELCAFLESTKSRPIDIRNKFNIAILNSLWRITTSERLKYDDPKLTNLLLLVDRFLQEGGKPWTNVIVNNKLLMWLAGKFNLLAFGKVFTDLRCFVEEAIDPLRSTFQEDSLRNFVDHFLKMSQEQEKAGSQPSFVGEEGKVNLVNLVIDLFLAGSETTSTTISWGMLYMILHPDIQSRVQAELDEAVGEGMQPRTADRARTPYTNAVIHEIQRLGNILDRSVPHATLRDCHLSTGHFIPRNTMVVCNLGHLMRDPEQFPEPLKFDPTRYLDANGKFRPHPRVVPFGIGKRRCLGEILAHMSLYVFFAGILARFRLEKAHPGDQPSTDAIEGLVRSPQPFKLRFIPRK